MKVYTQSGSMYEVDLNKKAFRKLAGTNTARTAQNGEGNWVAFEKLVPAKPEVNEPLMFVYQIEKRGDEFVMRTTKTTPVVLVEAQDYDNREKEQAN